MNINREYKDSLFTTLFNDAEKLLSLYNAVSGSNLPPDTPVEIATLEDVLFNYRRNDVAFVIDYPGLLQYNFPDMTKGGRKV